MLISMNIFTWILQIGLAFWEISGGAYLISNYSLVANGSALTTFPSWFWMLYAVGEIVLAVGLLYPARRIASISAIILAIMSLAGLALFSTFAGFPGMLWGIIPAILLAFVAYRRF